jgi:hypothetical protein
MIHISIIASVACLRRSGVVLCPVALGLWLLVVAASANEKPSEAPSAEVIQRGAAMGKSPSIRLADVLADPDRFEDKTVIFRGTVAEVCQTKGCWMKVLGDSSAVGVRVTFKDYGFFVPKDSKGMLVQAEGVFHVKMWSKDEADHLESDGAKLARNKDGTATELGFVAKGVELTPAKAAPESKTRTSK